jgi:uncharacterized protein (DUF849 family)
MRSALALVIAVGLAAHIQADGLQTTNPKARVRPMQRRVEALLATGIDRSATFRQLVHRIERSDVIVYVEASHDLRDGVGASMRFVTRSARDRYVRVRLNAAYSNHTLVALLGHELQHVVEVADHEEVQSPDDLREFYRRTGVRTGPDSFDSEEARNAGYLVRDEITRKPADLRLARGVSLEETRLLNGGSFTGENETGATGAH